MSAPAVVKLAGREKEADCDGVMLSPHRPQNLEFCGNGDEHRGHGKFAAASPALTIVKLRPPHRPQNFTPSANREPQLSQTTIPGSMLESLLLGLPCDGDGWLAVALCCFNWAWI